MTAIVTTSTHTTLAHLEQAETACEHPQHYDRFWGHDANSTVMRVQGRPIPCCGYTPKPARLCWSYIITNPYLSCSGCRVTGIPFGDAYTVLGPVEGGKTS